MIPQPNQSQPPMLMQQPDNRMSLAALLGPRQAPSSASSLLDPAKIMSFMKMGNQARADAPPQPAAGPDLSGNVMDPNKPFGKLVNALAGSDGLFGSNGPLQQQFGAPPSAMNTYNGPGVGAPPMSALSMPGTDPNLGIAPRWGG